MYCQHQIPIFDSVIKEKLCFNIAKHLHYIDKVASI
jgi:hypothetical protein